MRRHPALQDLSRDHFTALNHVVAVRRVVEQDVHAQPWDGVRAAFLDFARGELMTHFDEEEATLVPVLEGLGADRLLERFAEDHRRLRAGVAALGGDAAPAEAWAVAEALRTHARWEEDTLFESMQSALSEADLDALARASAAWRREHGRPVGPT